MAGIGVGDMKGRVETEGTGETLVIVGQDQVQGQLQNRDRIRCFKRREYNCFARDCLTRKASKEIEQIQQMLNMDENQTILQSP